MKESTNSKTLTFFMSQSALDTNAVKQLMLKLIVVRSLFISDKNYNVV